MLVRPLLQRYSSNVLALLQMNGREAESYAPAAAIPDAGIGEAVSRIVHRNLSARVTLDLICTPATPPIDLDSWLRPVEAWVRLTLQAVADARASLPWAARALALLSIGLDSVLTVARRLQILGRPCCRYTALAAMAEPLLSRLFPALHAQGMFRKAALNAAMAGIWAGATPEAAARGKGVGQDVADALLTRMALEGVVQPDAGRLPQWQYFQPVLRLAAVPCPPAHGSAEFACARMQFAAVQWALSDADRETALHWAYGPASSTIAGAWFESALNLIGGYYRDMQTAAHMLRTLGTILHDTLLVAWDAKYRYAIGSAAIWMQHRHPGWRPVLDIPPYPAYPSAHAMLSAAAAEVLTRFFPAHDLRLHQEAEEAAHSRILAGLHWEPDYRVGLLQGRQVALQILGTHAVGAQVA